MPIYNVAIYDTSNLIERKTQESLSEISQFNSSNIDSNSSLINKIDTLTLNEGSTDPIFDKRILNINYKVIELPDHNDFKDQSTDDTSDDEDLLLYIYVDITTKTIDELESLSPQWQPTSSKLTINKETNTWNIEIEGFSCKIPSIDEITKRSSTSTERLNHLINVFKQNNDKIYKVIK